MLKPMLLAALAAVALLSLLSCTQPATVAVTPTQAPKAPPPDTLNAEATIAAGVKQTIEALLTATPAPTATSTAKATPQPTVSPSLAGSSTTPAAVTLTSLNDIQNARWLEGETHGFTGP